MKIAVPFEDGQVFQHFGRSAQFKFYEAETASSCAPRSSRRMVRATAHWRAFSYSMAQTSCSAAASAPVRRWR